MVCAINVPTKCAVAGSGVAPHIGRMVSVASGTINSRSDLHRDAPQIAAARA